MIKTSIFVTYNPGNRLEQTIATRLHTIGAVSGFKMLLPDRYNSAEVLDNETVARINQSNYVVMFSLGKLSEIVKKELQIAFKHIKDRSKIIVVYDKQRGKNLKGDVTDNFTAFYFDKEHNNQDEILKSILKIVSQKHNKEVLKNTLIKNKKNQEEASAVAALVGVGLGLLVLGVLSGKK
jgi:hypothetical protein